MTRARWSTGAVSNQGMANRLTVSHVVVSPMSPVRSVTYLPGLYRLLADEALKLTKPAKHPRPVWLRAAGFADKLREIKSRPWRVRVWVPG